MKLLMIRHGEPCYANVKELNLLSYLGELTPLGVAQAEKVAKDDRLKDADIIIASPFTRALQTAAIISRITGIPLTVEPALHEILLDTEHEFTLDEKYVRASDKEFYRKNGKRDCETKYRWEEAQHIAERAYLVIKKYLNCKKVIVVSHATLIRTFGYKERKYPYCGIFEREFDENSEFENFVAWKPEYEAKRE